MHPSFHRVQQGALVYYTCDRIPVPHAFTTRLGGVSRGDCESLNLGFSRGDDPANVVKNYKIMADSLGISYDKMTATKQIHQNYISVVDELNAGTGISKPQVWQSDALVTRTAGVTLCGYSADCVVTLLYDPAGAAAVCHTGWRGVALDLIGDTVRKMQAEFGTKPQDLVAVIGPSIRSCCFETDADVPDALRDAFGPLAAPFITQKPPKFHVDLQGTTAALLRRAGVSDITDSGLCTMCAHDEFWSHRFTHGKRGVQAGMICL